MKPKFQKNLYLQRTQITNEPQTLKEHQISKETQITNKPQILIDSQIKKRKKLNYK